MKTTNSKVKAIHEGAASNVKGAWVSAAIAAAQVIQDGWGSKSAQGVTAKARENWGKVLFPSAANESWKYTSTDSIANGDYVLAGPYSAESTSEVVATLSATVVEHTLTALNPFLIVLIDGEYCAPLSSQGTVEGLLMRRGVELLAGAAEASAMCFGSTNVHAAASGASSFTALATALTTDVLSFEVAPGKVIGRPVQILSLTSMRASGTVKAPRIVITLGREAELMVLDTHLGVGGEGYLSLPVMETFVDEGARFHHVRFVLEHDTAAHVGHQIVHQDRNSLATSHVLSLGGRLVRTNADVELNGVQSNAVLNGLSVLGGNQHVDNSTAIHHVAPNCESRELFKGIYSGKSRGVFSGTIVVESEAQKTNAFQSNQTLLLSPDASVETRPQLKIWADDVKCTHGATIGQIDADALFYLRSRGIDKDSAKGFLVHAFAGEVLSTVGMGCPDGAVIRDYTRTLLTAKLGLAA